MTPQPPSDRKQDILQVLLQRGEVTAHELAAHLGISPQAIRRHLKDLEDEGAISHEATRGGTGRPQHRYRLSPQGRSRFPASYDGFAMDLLNTLSSTIGQTEVSELLRQQWLRKALEYRDRLGSGPLPERLARLVELRRAEGYMAEWQVIGPERSPRRYLLTEHNCAISTIAESYPTVCDHELELFAISLGGCKVERTHWIVGGEHRCGYEIEEPPQGPMDEGML